MAHQPGAAPRRASVAVGPHAGPGFEAAPAIETGGVPRLSVRPIARTVLIRLLDADILFSDSAVRAVADGLERLVADEGHTRLLLNLGGVRYVSGDLLDRLARIQNGVGRRGGYVRLCSVEAVVRDMLRLADLDRVLDVCDGEVDALGLVVR